MMLILSAMFTIAGGVTSSAVVTGNGTLIVIGATAFGLFLVLELVATFVLKSEDEKELLLLRQIRLRQLERGIGEAEAVDSRIREEIRNGNLQGAIDWIEVRNTLR